MQYKKNKTFRAKAHLTLVGGLALIPGPAPVANETPNEEVRPNILFLVVEDASPYLYPAYGNPHIVTPHLDRLASSGVVFTSALANAPYSSPARSSLISGSYATTYGNDWHRNNHIVPGHYFFPQYLREAGYFTVNAGKTDYNVTQEVQQQWYDVAWDRMSGLKAPGRPNASYNDEARGERPFFAQFNNNTSHMSRMNSVYMHLREPPRLDPEGVILPDYVPDLPETRSDYALHLDAIEDTDRWTGLFISDLEERGLLENTIIFYFSDHGGCLPRGKAFPYETGFTAALIIYAPPKWQHLLPAPPGSVSDRLVEFADFGPTLLSIAGVQSPGHMQGKAFMGRYAEDPREYSFNFRTNTTDHFDPSRSVFTSKFQYIRNYTPYKIHGLRQSYQWAMPAQMAWDSLFHFAETKPEHRQYYLPKPSEMLFDRKHDPFGMNNLAGEPEYEEVLTELRKAASTHIRESKDIGFWPRDVRISFVEKGIAMYDWVRENDYPFELLYRAVESASAGEPDERYFLEDLLAHERPEFRFWGASGLAYLAFLDQLPEVPVALFGLLDDPFGSVASMAAEALVYAGYTEKGLHALVEQAWDGNTNAISSLEQLGDEVESVLPGIRQLAENNNSNRIRFHARSILINFGEMPMAKLFEPAAVESFRRNQRSRVERWAPTRP